jgi:nitroimidazol reductase NimA-like FMN-containing flavoprotein (pyridoxamine 5'-phosphate oxidase superfamily)
MSFECELEGLEVLTAAECLRLLGVGRVGRVGFVSGGQPRVLPVNYAASSAGEIVFRTAERSILTEVAGAPAAFEVDGYDEARRTGWSVCVQGPAREITDSDDALAHRLRDLRVLTWAPGRRDRWFVIIGQEITGRRIPMTLTAAEFGWIEGVVS